MTPPTLGVAVFFFYLLSRQVNEKKTSRALSFYYIVYIHSINSWDRSPPYPSKGSNTVFSPIACFPFLIRKYRRIIPPLWFHSFGCQKEKKWAHPNQRKTKTKKKRQFFESPRAMWCFNVFSALKNARPCMHYSSSYIFLKGKEGW